MFSLSDSSRAPNAGRLRVLTLNLWGRGGDWRSRSVVVRDGIVDLAPDLIAFQEVFKTEEQDTAREVLGSEYHLYQQATGLLGDGNGAAIASRWPLRHVEELDQQLTSRTARFPATTLIAEVDAPTELGPLLFVNHLPSWEPQHEFERELQTRAAARRVEEIVGAQSMHVVLAGDLDAVPDAASIRFLRGLQSLGDLSVCYRDAWGSAHPDDPGHTFSVQNPLVMEDTDVRQEVSRRIDYVFVRCDEDGPTLEIAACELAFDQPAGGVWASDHIGVIAEFRAPGRGGS